jgi:hypothetical protein
VTQLRIRRKPEPVQRSPFTLVPMAAVMAGVLAIGVGTTLLLDSGQLAPTAVVEVATPRMGAAFDSLQEAYVKTQTFTANGKDWVPAAHATVTHFYPEEMVPAGQSGSWTLLANRSRGLPALSRKPTAYDRLYLDLGNSRYVPLRWRHVP